MSISNTTSEIRYNGDNTTVLFSFPFKVFETTDIEVYVVDANDNATLQTLTTHYSVSVNSTTEGGSVTMVTAPTSTEELLIKRVLDQTQDTELPNEGPLPSKSIENALDRQIMLLQEFYTALSKAPQFPDGTNITGVTIAGNTAGKGLYFDADGNLQLTDQDINTLTPTTDITAAIAFSTGVSDAGKVIKTHSDGYTHGAMLERPIRIVSTATDLDTKDRTVLLTNTTAILIRLPDPAGAGNVGCIRLVRRPSNYNAAVVTVAVPVGSGDTINGDSTYLMSGPEESVEMVYDSTNENWIVINEYRRKGNLAASGAGPVSMLATYYNSCTVDSSSGAIEIDLPFASGGQVGKRITIAKTSSDFNAVTLDPYLTETISGASTFVLYMPNESVTLLSNGSNWIVENHYIPAAANSFTPSWTNVTVGSGTNTGKWWRDGKFMGVEVEFTYGSGSSVSGTPIITLPSSFTIDTSFMAASTGNGVGRGGVFDSGTATFDGVMYIASTTTVGLVILQSNGTYAYQNVVSGSAPQASWATGDKIRMNFRVPIAEW